MWLMILLCIGLVIVGVATISLLGLGILLLIDKIRERGNENEQN